MVLALLPVPDYAHEDGHFILINIDNCNSKCYFWDNCYINVIFVIDLSVEKYMSTYFGLVTTILLTSFWNEYNEKNPVHYQKKSSHLYSYLDS